LQEFIQYLQIITDIIVIILFIGIMISFFYLLKILKTATSKFEELTAEVKDVKAKLNPVIEKSGLVADNVNLILSKVKDNIDLLETSVTKINNVVDDVVEFERKVQSKIEPPVMETANTIYALSAGIKTFFDSYKSSRAKKPDLIEGFNLNSDNEIESQLKENTDMELQNVNTKLNDLQN